jgi:hypothetical protein
MRTRRHNLLLALVTAGVLVALVMAGAGLLLAFRDEGRAGRGEPLASGPPPVTADEVRAFVTAALPALSAGDRAAWNAALPASGRARKTLDNLLTRLGPLQLSHLAASVTAPPGMPGAFDIVISGAPLGSGPPDRFVAERELVVKRSGGRLLVTGDETPPALKPQGFMAFHRPRVRRFDGAVLVYESAWRLRAEQMADLVPQAKTRVAEVLGARSDQPVFIFVFSSERQVAQFLGRPDMEKRIKFFSGQPVRVSDSPWSIGDIGIVAPDLAGRDDWAPTMLAHEMAHALTEEWFDDAPQVPRLLLEGIGVAVEGERSYAALKGELLSGNKDVPLMQAMAYASLWQSNDIGRVDLLYEEGGSLVRYILAGWGRGALRRFALDVGTSDLTESPIRYAVQRDLHVSWGRFYAGWRDYVLALP